MSFPPGEALAAEMLFYRLGGMAERLGQLLSPWGLAGTVEHSPETAAQYIKVSLPAGGKVILLFHRKGAWIIGGPPTGGLTPDGPTAWPLETDEAELLRTVSGFVRAHVERQPLQSPWVWGRTSASPITDLADALLIAGVPRDAVDVPRRMSVEEGTLIEDYGSLDRLTIKDGVGYEHCEVAQREHLGWTVAWFVNGEEGSFGRMNLRRALLAGDEPYPDTPLDQVSLSDLAALLAETLGYRQLSGHYGRLRRCAATPRWCPYNEAAAKRNPDYDWLYDARVCVSWLRWAGYTDCGVQLYGKRPTLTARALSIHLHRAKKPVDLGLVQRVFGQASAEGRRAVIVSRTSFTRSARTWAEQAGVALMQLEDGAPLRAASALAGEMMPDPAGEFLSECDNTSCLQTGCMLEDELCPNEKGKMWSSPEFERWYLGGQRDSAAAEAPGPADSE
jgi:hypothetical protein